MLDPLNDSDPNQPGNTLHAPKDHPLRLEDELVTCGSWQNLMKQGSSGH